MQSETLAQEFARLVKEYHEGDDHTKPEAWNLLADYAVENAAAISAALSEQERAVEMVKIDADLERKIFEILTHGYPAPFARVDRLSKQIARLLRKARPALVDVPAEPVAWYRNDSFTHRFSLGPSRPKNATQNPDEWKPLFASPPLSRQGEDSAEVVPHGLAERCGEILEWKKTGKLPGDSLRQLGQSIADRLGGSLFIDNGLNQAELATIDEALKLIVALAATRSGSATSPGGRDDA